MRVIRQLLTGALLVGAASACAASAGRITAEASRRSDDLERANKELLRHYFEDVFNGRRIELLAQMVAPDVVVHAGDGSVTRGSQGLREGFTRLWAIFPDAHLTIEEMVAEGDRVAVRLRASGTQRGAIWGIQPSGRQLAIPEWFFYRIVGGKIAEYWYLRDHAEARRQLQAP